MMGTLSAALVILEAGLKNYYSGFSSTIVLLVMMLDILVENCLRF